MKAKCKKKSYLLLRWYLWHQTTSEMQVEFYVSDVQEVGDRFAVTTFPTARRRHLRATWPHVATAAAPPPPVSLSVSCLHFSPLFLPFTQIIILTPVSVGAVSAVETYWRSTYSSPRVIFRTLVPNFFHSEAQLDGADAYFWWLRSFFFLMMTGNMWGRLWKGF